MFWLNSKSSLWTAGNSNIYRKRKTVFNYTPIVVYFKNRISNKIKISKELILISECMQMFSSDDCLSNKYIFSYLSVLFAIQLRGIFWKRESHHKNVHRRKKDDKRNEKTFTLSCTTKVIFRLKGRLFVCEKLENVPKAIFCFVL